MLINGNNNKNTNGNNGNVSKRKRKKVPSGTDQDDVKDPEAKRQRLTSLSTDVCIYYKYVFIRFILRLDLSKKYLLYLLPTDNSTFFGRFGRYFVILPALSPSDLYTMQ